MGKNWPESKTTAAGVRMMQLLHFFVKNYEHVHFASAAASTNKADDLESLGIQTHSILLNSNSFDQWIDGLNPELVVFDRFMVEEQFSWRVRKAAPEAILMLNTEDLHSLREAREKAHDLGQTFSAGHWREHLTTSREIGSLLRCDLNLFVSSFEMAWLKRELIQLEPFCELVPFMYPELTQKQLAELPGFEQRTGFVFIGTGKHKPNQDAIHWLITEIWPLILKQLPQASLEIVGDYWTDQNSRILKKTEGVRFTGQIHDLNSFLAEKRVNVLPLRYGAGIKGKLAEGMRAGCVAITTDQGVEGLLDGLGFPGICINSAQEFAANAVALYLNKSRWEQLVHKIPDFFNANWSEDQGHQILASRINRLHLEYRRLRKNNVLQQTILHHRLRSTEYLSRYIELKNQKE